MKHIGDLGGIRTLEFQRERLVTIANLSTRPYWSGTLGFEPRMLAKASDFKSVFAVDKFLIKTQLWFRCVYHSTCSRYFGTPEGTQTPDLALRRRLLYSAELLGHVLYGCFAVSKHYHRTWVDFDSVLRLTLVLYY